MACDPLPSGASYERPGFCAYGCAQGFFLANSTKECRQCPAFSSAAAGSVGADACQCIPGYTRASELNETCVICPASTFKEGSGPASCSPCANGPARARYLSGQVSAECEFECEPGYSGADCSACEAGTFKELWGGGACEACLAGQRSPPASVAQSACSLRELLGPCAASQCQCRTLHEAQGTLHISVPAAPSSNLTAANGTAANATTDGTEGSTATVTPTACRWLLAPTGGTSLNISILSLDSVTRPNGGASLRISECETAECWAPRLLPHGNLSGPLPTTAPLALPPSRFAFVLVEFSADSTDSDGAQSFELAWSASVCPAGEHATGAQCVPCLNEKSESARFLPSSDPECPHECNPGRRVFASVQ